MIRTQDKTDNKVRKSEILVEKIVSLGEPSEVANMICNITPGTHRGFCITQILTLTYLSQPQETITAFVTFGLNRTHETLKREYERKSDIHSTFLTIQNDPHP